MKMSFLIYMGCLLALAGIVAWWIIMKLDHQTKLRRFFGMRPEQLENDRGFEMAKHRLNQMAEHLKGIDESKPSTDSGKEKKLRRLVKAHRNFYTALHTLAYYRDDLGEEYHNWKTLIDAAHQASHSERKSGEKKDHGSKKESSEDHGDPKEDHSSRNKRPKASNSKSENGTRPKERKWWDVLGIREDADWETVKASWRGLISHFHPDTAPDKKGNLDKLREVNDAYREAKKAHGIA